MYSNSKLNKRVFSFILALCLVLNLLLTSGIIPAAVWAADEASAPTGTTQVLYVDGKGSGNKDGSSEANALQYVSEAYAKIPDDNVKTTIVICGSVDMAKDPGLIKFTDSYGTEYTYYRRGENALMHSGEVVFTSNGSGSLTLPTRLALTGNTTFENIKIGNRAYQMYGNYFTLRIGEGVDVSNWANLFADTLYLGTNASLFAHFDATSEKIKVRDVELTMESGAINKLYGGGSSDQGWSNRQTAYNLEMNLMGGTVNNLYLASNGYNSDGHTPISDATLVISGGTVGTLNKKTGNGTVTGTVTNILDLKGQAVSMNVGAGLEISVVDSEVKQIDGVVTGGTFINTGAGSVSTKAIKDPTSKMYFLAVENEGSYSAYPFNMTISAEGINTIAKNPDDETATEPAACLRATFMAFDALMDKITDHGIMIDGVKSSAKGKYDFDSNIIQAYADLNGSFREDKINVAKTVQAYVTIGGVDYVSTARVVTPSAIVEALNTKIDTIESQYHKQLITELMERIGG